MTEVERLQQAIAALDAQRGMLGNAVVETALAPLQEKLAQLQGEVEDPVQERRLVSVLFADITGSTQLSHGLEPEDVLQVMEGALHLLAGPVQEHGGRVTRFMGDGFQAVFGIPTARENEAEQAVRAGLGILALAHSYAEELERTRGLPGFNVRVGISTGTVATGGTSDADGTVMGLPVNLGARLESAAPPGGLLISEETYRQVGSVFDVEPQTPITAKGFEKPVPSYLVVRARPRTFRTITRGVGGVETRMIGRDAELAELQRLYVATMEGSHPHLVTVVGEAGVGKSRLLYEFDRWLARRPENVVAFKGRADPEVAGTPYGLLRDLLARRFGIRRSDPAAEAREKLERGLAAHWDQEAEMKAHYVGALLGYSYADSPYLAGVRDDARQVRDQALYYLLQFLTSVSQQANTVVMVEDIHWTDDASLQAMTSILRGGTELPLLVVCLTRPDFFEMRPDWDRTLATGGTRYSRIDLVRLPPSASSELVCEILQRVDALPQALQDRIIDAADGNPFYIEELIKVLLHDGVIVRDQGGDSWRLSPSELEALPVPSTLTALLQARLDRLPFAQKLVLQQGSVYGRSFWGEAVRHVQQAQQPPLGELAGLVARDLIYPQSESAFAHTDEYAFKHPLMRQVTYDTLFKQVRVLYHRRAADWLIETTMATGRADEYSPVIAGHLELASEGQTAGQWYARAGELAKTQGALLQARGSYSRALDLLPAGESEWRWRALLGRNEVVGLLGDLEDRETDDAALISLARELQDDAKLAVAYMRQGMVPRLKGDYRRELEAFDRALEAARRSGNLKVEALTLGLQVVALSRLGEMGQAAELADQALCAADALGDQDTVVRNLTNVSVFFTESGDIARGAELLARQVEICHGLGYREGEVAGLVNLGYNYVQLGLHPAAVEALERSFRMSDAIGHRLMAAYARLNLGLARIRQGELEAAQQVLADCMTDLCSLGDRFGQAACQGYWALAQERSGAIESASSRYAQARTAFQEMGAAAYAKDASAGMGRCQLAQGQPRQAAQEIAEVWSCLSSGAGVAMEFPVLGFLTCADVFAALEEPGPAGQAVELGHHYLQESAARIENETWRQAYLDNVVEHRQIVKRWKEHNHG